MIFTPFLCLNLFVPSASLNVHIWEVVDNRTKLRYSAGTLNGSRHAQWTIAMPSSIHPEAVSVSPSGQVAIGTFVPDSAQGPGTLFVATAHKGMVTFKGEALGCERDELQSIYVEWNPNQKSALIVLHKYMGESTIRLLYKRNSQWVIGPPSRARGAQWLDSTHIALFDGKWVSNYSGLDPSTLRWSRHKVIEGKLSRLGKFVAWDERHKALGRQLQKSSDREKVPIAPVPLLSGGAFATPGMHEFFQGCARLATDGPTMADGRNNSYDESVVVDSSGELLVVRDYTYGFLTYMDLRSSVLYILPAAGPNSPPPLRPRFVSTGKKRKSFDWSLTEFSCKSNTLKILPLGKELRLILKNNGLLGFSVTKT